MASEIRTVCTALATVAVLGLVLTTGASARTPHRRHAPAKRVGIRQTAHAPDPVFGLEGSQTPAGPSLSRVATATQLRGVDLHPMASDENASVISQEFRLLHSIGATSVRFDIFWTAVEWTAKGDYDPNTLAWLDWVFAQAHANGLKVVLDVWSTPCWASSAPALMKMGCGPGWWNQPVRYYPPTNPQDYADFCAFAAKRWGYALGALELWNEPNGTFLYTTGNRAAVYASLVKAAYPAVKAVAPNLPVIMSLAGTDIPFLSQLYADGVKGYYDGVGVHPYFEPNLAGLKAFHAYQLTQGDNTPLWVTEIGWSTSNYSPQTQASNIASALEQLAELPYVVDVDVYEMRDEGSNPSDSEDHFGIMNQNLTAKPAWNALGSTVQLLAQRQHVSSTWNSERRPSRSAHMRTPAHRRVRKARKHGRKSPPLGTVAHAA